MKIFVFSTHILWPSHYETELELMQNHLNSGDEVYHFVCDGELSTCDINPEHALLKCLRCRDIRVCGEKLLKGDIKKLPIIHSDEKVHAKADSFSFTYHSIEELQKIQVDNFDLGYAAVSSVVSFLREPKPNIEKNREMIDQFLKSSLNVYFSAIRYIHELKPDLIYVFNGRFAHVSPILKAAIANNVKCLVHERGHDKDHYSLFTNTTPHNRAYVVNRMQKLWDEADPDDRVLKGKSFYEERVAGKDQGWYSFTKNQQKGKLPSDWDESKRNITIFNSSEDEFASIGPDWKNELYSTQLNGIRRIVSDCVQETTIHFYLRIHPNLANVDNSEMNELTNLHFPNLTIIDPTSPISTYDLLFNSEKVIAFGSSVGIEAVYWRKPSIQAGKSYYYGLNATYKPSSHEELVAMVKKKLEPMNEIPALVYGHYFKSFGLPFKYYQAIDLFNGKFKGVHISQCEQLSTKAIREIRKKRVISRFTHYVENRFHSRRMKIPWFL